jgi:hypothetical protein
MSHRCPAENLFEARFVKSLVSQAKAFERLVSQAKHFNLILEAIVNWQRD